MGLFDQNSQSNQNYNISAFGTPASYGDGSTVINGSLGNPSTAAKYVNQSSMNPFSSYDLQGNEIQNKGYGVNTPLIDPLTGKTVDRSLLQSATTMAQDTGMVAPGTLSSYGNGSTVINGSLGNPSTAANYNNLLPSNYGWVTSPTNAQFNALTRTPFSQMNNTPLSGVPNTPSSTTGQTTPSSNPFGSNPFMGSTNPYIQAAQATAAGNINAAQAATAANRVNQTTPYGNLQYSQTGTDANGNPIWTANQTLSKPLEDLTNTSLSNLNASLNNPMYGINPGQTYSDAIMSRLQPQIAHQNEMSDQALANQGIMPGSQAYENAKRVLGQQQNDLLTSAIIGGMNTGLAAQNIQNTTAANVKSLGTPNYVNPYSQATVAAPDYLGAYSTANAADIAKSNAELARQNALTTGLVGLGSSALLGGTGQGSVLGSLSSGLGNLWSQLFPTSSTTAYNNLTGLTGNEAGNLDYFNANPTDTSYLDSLINLG